MATLGKTMEEKRQRIIDLNQQIVGIISNLIDKCAELGDLYFMRPIENNSDALLNYLLVEHCLEYLETTKSNDLQHSDINGIKINDYLSSIKNNIGICIYKQQIDIESAIWYFEKADEMREEDLNGRSRSLLYQSICHMEKDDKDDNKANECLERIHKIRESQKDDFASLEQEKYFLEQELQKRQTQHDLQGVAGIKCDLGMMCERMRNRLETSGNSRSETKKTIKTFNKNAIDYYTSSLATMSLPDACNALILNRLAEIYDSEGNKYMATRYAEKALQKGRRLHTADRNILDQIFATTEHCTILRYYPPEEQGHQAWIDNPKEIVEKASQNKTKYVRRHRATTKEEIG